MGDITDLFRERLRNLKEVSLKIAQSIEAKHRKDLWPWNKLKASGLKKSAKIGRRMKRRPKGQQPRKDAQKFRATEEDVKLAHELIRRHLTGD